jgi:predicted transcriptional regulator of viral defense system
MLFLTSNSDKMYIEFKNHFSSWPLISLLEIEKAFPKLDKRRLFEWSQKGYIVNVKRGFYRFTDQPINQGLLYFAANKLYHPSYISLETALSYYHVIPEAVFSFTSISTLNTTQQISSLGNFSYKHLKANLFFGYKLIEINGLNSSIANLEKTILDYLYFHSELKTTLDFQALRWDKERLKEMDFQKLEDYLTLFESKALKKRYSLLINYLND